MAPPRASRPLEGALGSARWSGVLCCTPQALKRETQGAVGVLAQELGPGDIFMLSKYVSGFQNT